MYTAREVAMRYRMALEAVNSSGDFASIKSIVRSALTIEIPKHESLKIENTFIGKSVSIQPEVRAGEY